MAFLTRPTLTLLGTAATAAVVYAIYRHREPQRGTEAMNVGNEPEAYPSEPSATGEPDGETLDTAGVTVTAAQTKRSVEALALAGELNARNMEAMMSIARIAIGGVEALAQGAIAQTRRSSEHAVEALHGLAGARTMSDILSVQRAYLEARRCALMDQAAVTRRITEQTSRAVLEGCSARAQKVVVEYKRIMRS
jgi:hypothetical protein